MGDDYPSETFRGLKKNETREFGEYRTRRLVLEAWDAQQDLIQVSFVDGAGHLTVEIAGLDVTDGAL